MALRSSTTRAKRVTFGCRKARGLGQAWQHAIDGLASARGQGRRGCENEQPGDFLSHHPAVALAGYAAGKCHADPAGRVIVVGGQEPQPVEVEQRIAVDQEAIASCGRRKRLS